MAKNVQTFRNCSSPNHSASFYYCFTREKLLILSKDGAKEALVDLSPSLYKQPEGICFTPDGNLFISSEGDGGDGYILKFDYKNKIVTVKQTSHYNQIAGQPIIYNSQFITNHYQPLYY